MTYHATCACGAVRLEAEGEPVLQCYCHCTLCRGMTGAPVNAVALWPRDAVQFATGEDRLTRFQRPGTPSIRLGCRACGGLVGSDLPHAALFDIFAGLVRDLDFAPTLHLNYGNAVLRIRDGLPKFRDMPEHAGGSGALLAE